MVAGIVGNLCDILSLTSERCECLYDDASLRFWFQFRQLFNLLHFRTLSS